MVVDSPYIIMNDLMIDDLVSQLGRASAECTGHIYVEQEKEEILNQEDYEPN